MTAIPVALAVLLPGVEIFIDVSHGASGIHGSVLLDRATWAEKDLPKRGNRPRVDAGSGRWWYDIMCSTTDFKEPLDSPDRTKTLGWARARFNEQVESILVDLAAARLRRVIEGMLWSTPDRARIGTGPQPTVDPSALVAARTALADAMLALDALGVKR